MIPNQAFFREDIFTFNGEHGHKIIRIKNGMLIESGLYEQAVISSREADVNLS